MIKNKIILSELFNMRKLVIYYEIFRKLNAYKIIDCKMIFNIFKFEQEKKTTRNLVLNNKP